MRMLQQRPLPAPSPVEALVPTVTAWCRRLAAPGVDAEAAAQEVLLVLVRRQAELRPGEPAAAWAWGIMTRTLAAHRRRAWLRRWLPGPVPDRAGGDDPRRTAERNELATQVRQVLDRLSDGHREVLVLCDVEERSRAEVACLLGVPEGTVKSRLRLARAAFRHAAQGLGIHFVALEEDHA